MENAVARPRYTRRPAQNRRRRKVPGTRDGLGRIMVRQLIICILLLLIVWIARGVNFSAANFVTDKVKYVISYNVELKSVFATLEKVALEVRNSISPRSAVNPVSSEKGATGASQNSSTTQTTDTTQTSGITQTSPRNTSLAGGNELEQETDLSAEVPAEQENTTMPETSVLSASNETEMPDPSGMLLPVEGTLISRFGEKSGDTAGNGKVHKGIDIDVSRGVAIKAVLDGKITETGSSPSYGSYIRILHENGLQTIYANCSGVIGKKGDIVKRGDTIAEIGGKGASVGIHLHFEVWKDGSAVDPLEYITVPVS